MTAHKLPSPSYEAQVVTMGVEMKSNSQMIQDLLSKLSGGPKNVGSQSTQDMQRTTRFVNVQQLSKLGSTLVPLHSEAQQACSMLSVQRSLEMMLDAEMHREMQGQFEERQATFEQHQLMQQNQQPQQQRQPQRQTHPQMHAPHKVSLCEQQLQPTQHAQDLGSLQVGLQQLSPHPQQHCQHLQQQVRPQHVPLPQGHHLRPEQFEPLKVHQHHHQEQHYQQPHPQQMPAYVQQHVQGNSPASLVLGPPPGLGSTDQYVDSKMYVDSTMAGDDDGSSEPSQFSSSNQETFPVPDERKQKDDSSYTTLMVRNIPPMYTEEMLLEEWSEDTFNFLYLPRGGRGKANVGYAFLNMTTPEQAVAFKARWNKVGLAVSSNRKILNVSFAAVQGLRANLVQMAKKIRNHSLEARGCHPIIVSNGRRVTLTQALQSLSHGCGASVAAKK